jgi:peptidoglycan/LPS O-acetylase OafA/YrhL
VLPLLLILVNPRRLSSVVIGLILAGLFVRGLTFTFAVAPESGPDSQLLAFDKWIYRPTHCRLDGLIVGVGIACLFQYQSAVREWLIRKHRFLMFSSLLVFVLGVAIAIVTGLFGFSVFGFPVFALAFGLLVTNAISPNSLMYRTDSRLVGWVATLSYSAYLCHKITIHVTQTTLGGWGLPKDGISMFTACVVSTVVFSFAMHMLIERPALKLRKIALKTHK